MRKLINWCNEYGLYVITLFLLAFIPLYPKLPLINVIRSWVYIRFEDFLMLLSTAFLFITMIREKKVTNSPLKIPILTYWVIGGLSTINAILFIFPHISGMFPHLALLHYARRFEYMIVCFIAYEAFRRKPLIRPLLWTLIGSYLVVILYGFGQKFLGFPAFLTMNEEFAKGVPLRLPSTARFPSTFGGHYDLAAYLILVIPIMGSFIFGVDKLWKKIGFFFLTFFGLIMLLFTASRISFGVYLVVMSIMLFWQKKKIWIIPMIIVSIVILNFTSGASERFYKTFRVSDVVVDLSTGKPIGTLDSITGTQATLAQSQSPAEETLPTGSEYLSLASGGTTDNQVKSVQLYTSKNITGADGEVATVSGSFLIQKALVYDISITTRFQGEWPKAIEAFKRNLLLGSGYSSLSVAVDGDYHRMLGETGLLGAISFLGIFAASFLLFMKRRKLLSPMESAFVIGVYAGIVGLLCNAVLIDVFEASKVAFVLWILLGIATAMLVAKKPFTLTYFKYIWHLATRKVSIIGYLVIAILVIWRKTFGLYFMGDDFTWLRWAAESTPKDLLKYFTHAQGFFYRPIPKLWYFGMFSVFWLKPFVYHVASVLLLAATSLVIYRVLFQMKVSKFFRWVGALLFAALSIHHENVYWISGQSSLLAGLFLIAAVSLRIESIAQKKMKPLFIIGSFLMLMLSMGSYDGMLIAPVILLVVSLVWEPKQLWNWIYLLFIPGYWFLRKYAGAVASEGDYGYKLTTFFINSIANGIGYTIAMFAGPAVIDQFTAIRMATKPYLKELTAGTALISLLILRVVWSMKSWIINHKKIVAWFVCYGVAFAAYIPLGGMAERYAYIPSIFFVLGVVSCIDVLWSHARFIWKTVLLLVIAAVLFFNIREVMTLSSDWQKAGSIVEQSLRVIKKEAWPPKNIKNFLIINMPIRYGRAWVYPTGMNDALWHMYRQNPFTVTQVPSIEEGYNRYFKNGDREVFIFEDWTLKRGVMDTITVPVTKSN